MEYYNTILEEQETVINIDYYKRELNIYSSRKSVMKRLNIKLGEPKKIFKINELQSGACWEIPFNEKERIRNALSKTILIAQLK